MLEYDLKELESVVSEGEAAAFLRGDGPDAMAIPAVFTWEREGNLSTSRKKVSLSHAIQNGILKGREP